MNGPFFCERMLLALPLHNELVRSFVVACLVTQRRHTPRGHRVITLNAAFTAAMRMIDGIHHDTAYRRPNAFMTRSAGLTDSDIFMIEIADLSDRCEAIHIHQPHFAGWQFHVG